ncbi:RlpA-like double-psi beta-barrel-protein domain-containing protein-containing protein [Xylaria intraflava]|nr:RlpA-like double-psi beta-barrel-protein domain-containing protein-containing protein [Xylaria intraflava]
MPSLFQIFVALGTVGSVAALPISNRSGTLTGDMTFYQPGLGACGETDSASEDVVALSPAQFTGSCGRTITVTKDGRTAEAKVVDLCPSCASGAIDVSLTVFQSLADPAVGRTTVSWSYTG